VPNSGKTSLDPCLSSIGVCHKAYLNTSFSFLTDCFADLVC
jgi:hypothetical protein